MGPNFPLGYAWHRSAQACFIFPLMINKHIMEAGLAKNYYDAYAFKVEGLTLGKLLIFTFYMNTP